MKRGALMLLCLSCTMHERELEATRTRLERDLAEKKAIANNLNEYRKEMDALEERLAEARAAVDAGAAPALVFPAEHEREPPVTLPPESMFEGSGGKRLRQQIADLERRNAELDRVIGEVKNINRHKKAANDELERLNQLRQPKSTAPRP